MVTVQEIKKLEPIEGADLIEKATVLGWSCVVQKGEFKEGDRCIFCEPDTLLPDKPEFEFLRARKFRVGVIRLKGQISQGLVLPISLIGDYPPGTEVSLMIGATHYEKPIPLQMAGMVKGNFPLLIPKTDELRIQSYPQVLERYRGMPIFYITEKIDGSSMTMFIDDKDEFSVCSRNINLKDAESNVFWRVAKGLNIINRFPKYIAIQGELVGPGINGNNLKLKEHRLYVFNAFNFKTGDYLYYGDLCHYVRILGLTLVPIIAEAATCPDTIQELEKMAEGMSLLNNQVQREGIVFRAMNEARDYDLGRLSFKVINPLYSLKYER